jgi:hypothetical protein
MKIAKIFDPFGQLAVLTSALSIAAMFGGMLYDFFVNERTLFVHFPESLKFVRDYWHLAQPHFFFDTLGLVQAIGIISGLLILWARGHTRKRNLLLLAGLLLAGAQWLNMFYFKPQNDLIKYGDAHLIDRALRGLPVRVGGESYNSGFMNMGSGMPFGQGLHRQSMMEGLENLGNIGHMNRRSGFVRDRSSFSDSGINVAASHPDRYAEDVKIIGKHHQAVEKAGRGHGETIADDRGLFGGRDHYTMEDEYPEYHEYYQTSPNVPLYSSRKVNPIPIGRLLADVIRLGLMGLSTLFSLWALTSKFTGDRPSLTEQAREGVKGLWNKLPGRRHGRRASFEHYPERENEVVETPSYGSDYAEEYPEETGYYEEVHRPAIKERVRQVGQSVKNAANRAVETAKVGTQKAVDTVKIGAQKAADTAKIAGQKAADTAKVAGQKVAETAKVGAAKAQVGAKKAADSVKVGSQKATDAVKRTASKDRSKTRYVDVPEQEFIEEELPERRRYKKNREVEIVPSTESVDTSISDKSGLDLDRSGLGLDRSGLSLDRDINKRSYDINKSSQSFDQAKEYPKSDISTKKFDKYVPLEGEPEFLHKNDILVDEKPSLKTSIGGGLTDEAELGLRRTSKKAKKEFIDPATTARVDQTTEVTAPTRAKAEEVLSEVPKISDNNNLRERPAVTTD